MRSSSYAVSLPAWIAILLLLYAVWARAGIYPPFQPLMLSITAILALSVFFLKPDRFDALRNALRGDPVFWAGGGMALLLAVQWVNTGYVPYNNDVGDLWLEPEPSAWLPWSITPDSAAQPLTWFVPVWILILTTRHLLERSGIRQVLYVILWNSALVAALGIIQQLAGAERMLGLWEIPGGSFFATFGYVNHGAAFFYLNAAVAVGLVHDSATRGRPPVQTAVWIVCALLNLAAAFLTLSRAGAIGGLVVSAAAAIALVIANRSRLRGTVFLHSALAALLILLVGAVLFLGVGKGRLSDEFSKTFSTPDGVAKEVESRAVQVQHTWQILKEYPLFGSGGWGYRWLAKEYIPMAEWADWSWAGRANVHCDPFQFLSEFGLFGAVCMSVVLGTLLARAARGGPLRPLSGWVAGGLLLVFLHSFIDLPFRCPAILFEWCFLLAALPFWRNPRPV